MNCRVVVLMVKFMLIYNNRFERQYVFLVRIQITTSKIILIGLSPPACHRKRSFLSFPIKCAKHTVIDVINDLT